jgi:hypothetical protein
MVFLDPHQLYYEVYRSVEELEDEQRDPREVAMQFFIEGQYMLADVKNECL